MANSVRKTSTSTAVKQKYIDKSYTKLTVWLKPELDASLRAYLKREGISRAEFLQRALDRLEDRL